MFAELEKMHGQTLVSRALGYLTISEYHVSLSHVPHNQWVPHSVMYLTISEYHVSLSLGFPHHQWVSRVTQFWATPPSVSITYHAALGNLTISDYHVSLSPGLPHCQYHVSLSLWLPHHRWVLRVTQPWATSLTVSITYHSALGYLTISETSRITYHSVWATSLSVRPVDSCITQPRVTSPSMNGIQSGRRLHCVYVHAREYGIVCVWWCSAWCYAVMCSVCCDVWCDAVCVAWITVWGV